MDGWDLVERWWNGLWGRLARRDMWLKTNGQLWAVQARKGDGDARVWTKVFDTEAEARQLAQEMRARSQVGVWTDITAAGRQSPQPDARPTGPPAGGDTSHGH